MNLQKAPKEALLPRSENYPEQQKVHTRCTEVPNSRHTHTCSLARMWCDWAGSLSSGRLSPHPGSTSLPF